MKIFVYFVHFGIVWNCINAWALENTKVLPKGRRSVTLRTVDTNINSKTDSDGNPQALSEPLQKDLTFKKVLKGENDPLKKSLIQAFLQSNGFDENEALGTFTADMNGHVQAFAPIIAYGITDRFTIALAVPYMSAQTSVKAGFVASPRSEEFIRKLSAPEYNLIKNAREVADKLNNATAKLDQKLLDNGFQALKNWEGHGFGDMTLGAKYAAVTQESFRVATTSGVVAPTGRVKDPDILNDVGFGDGQWDFFQQVTLEQPMVWDVTFSQHAKYTYQAMGRKKIRDASDDDSIEVPKVETEFKLGNKIEGGVGALYAPSYGLLTGLGYTYFFKYADKYTVKDSGLRQDFAEKDTGQRSQNLELLIGYSGIPAFQRGEIAAPFEVKLSYYKQLRSINTPVSDLYQFDASLYF